MTLHTSISPSYAHISIIIIIIMNAMLSFVFDL